MKKIITITAALIAISFSLVFLAFDNTPFYKMGEIEGKIVKDKTIIAKANDISITQDMLNQRMAWIDIQNQGITEKSKKLTQKDAFNFVVEETLLLKDVEAKGLSVSLAEAKDLSNKTRIEFDKSADNTIKENLKQYISGLNFTEDQYWNEFAPKAYQTALSIGKLKESITKEEKDGNKVNKMWKEYTEDLRNKAKIDIIKPEVLN